MKIPHLLILLIWVLLWMGGPARAGQLTLAENLPLAVLAENSTPASFSPDDLSTQDFELDWEGEPARLEWVTDSLEWVRVSEILVLPRARLRIFTPGAVAGHAEQASSVSPLLGEQTEIPVALFPESQVSIRVSWRNQAGKSFSGVAHLHFRPRKPPLVVQDTSCSRFGFTVEYTADVDPSWIYLGCRSEILKGDSGHVPAAEVYVFWSGKSSEGISLNGVALPLLRPGLSLIRIGPGVNNLVLSRGKAQVSVRAQLSESAHRGMVGIGLGPYSYGFIGGTQDVETYAAEITLYGAYYLDDTTRLTAFGASAIQNTLYGDFGLYLETESFRLLDRRVSINLLLGVHAVAFRPAASDYLFKVGVPQGLEFIFYDFLSRGKNLSVGGFLYPLIDGKSYTDIWFRYGTSRLFGEINYISWQESAVDASGATNPYYSRSFGIAIGMPLAHFL